MGSKIKLACTVVATAFVAFGATGYAGALPRDAQNIAHRLIGAPGAGAPHGKPKHPNGPPGRPAHKDTPVGPDARGPAAHGLCNAYLHSHKHGAGLAHSVAQRNLARAAAGRAHIQAYCATIPQPSASEPARTTEPEPSETEPSETEPSEPEPSETD
jgi:hypothetical protein